MAICCKYFAQLLHLLVSNNVDAVLCCSQDTVTGFLLAGIGNMDLRRKGNFLVVNESAHTDPLEWIK